MMLSFDITSIKGKNLGNKLFGKKKKLFWLTSIKLETSFQKLLFRWKKLKNN